MDLVKSGCIWLLSLSYRWIESDFVLKNWRKKWGLGLYRILPIEQWIVPNLTILFLGGAVASLCWASYLGSQHDATRIRSSGACTRYRWTTGTRRVQQLSIDICCTRPSSEANQPHVAAAVHRRDRWMDGRTRDPAPRTMRTAPINLHSGLDYALGWCGIRWVGLRLAKPCLSLIRCLKMAERVGRDEITEMQVACYVLFIAILCIYIPSYMCLLFTVILSRLAICN